MTMRTAKPVCRGLRLGLAAMIGFAAAGSGIVALTAFATSAGADTTLGGFTVAASASGMTVSYEQPNFPVPANPSVELDVGYSSTTDNYGPSGSATASSLYPGQVVANAGPQLSLLLPGVPLPPAPAYPVQATAICPKGPDATNNTTPGNTMEADCGTDFNTATATFGIPGSPPAGPPSASSSSSGVPGLGPLLGAGSGLGTGSSSTPPTVGNDLLSMQGLSSTSSSGAAGSDATATATSDASGISILGGLITIGSLSSTATAISNGDTARLTGSSAAQDVVVAGEEATIDATGVHAAGDASPPDPLYPAVQQLLSTLGITMTLTHATDTVNGPQASRQLDGLRIQVDLTRLDDAANTVSKLIPESVLANLPLPLPDKQILVLDMGWVDVTSAASPAYAFNGTTSSDSNSPSGLAGGSLPGTIGGIGSTGSLGTDNSLDGGGSDLGGSSLSPSGSPAESSTSGTTGPGNPFHAASTAAATPLFKGISGGLLALVLLAAAAIGLVYLQAQSMVETAGTSATCPMGETVGAGDAGDELFGGDPLYRGIETSSL